MLVGANRTYMQKEHTCKQANTTYINFCHKHGQKHDDSCTQAHTMASEELKAHAASKQDFYALLEVSAGASETEIRRAYRRTALKYHPDKITSPTAADIDKFHLLQIAYDVLSEPSARQLYDNARQARQRKQRERDMLDAAKRKMREDLESRERAGAAGVKRTWSAAAGAAGAASGSHTADGDQDDAELQRTIARIVEDAARRRREIEQRLKREAEQEEQEDHRTAGNTAPTSSATTSSGSSSSRKADTRGSTNVAELDRAVKVRWVRRGRGLTLDRDRLLALLSPFGKVENAFMLKDKRQRIGDGRDKATVATGVVVFQSIVGAHAAVLDCAKMKAQSAGRPDDGADGDDWAVVDSIIWASDSQPALASAAPPLSPRLPKEEATADAEVSSSKADPFSFLGKTGKTGKPGKTPPVFSSFSTTTAPAAQRIPTTTAQGSAAAPSFEELTLMRLKTAQREKERKALEDQLRREDEAADAAEAASASAAQAG